MSNFQEKNPYIKFIHSKLGLIFLGIFLVFFTFNIIKFLLKANETARNRKIAEENMIKLETQKERLNIDIEKLKTDKGTEEIIRDKFGFAKQGEGLVVVVDSTNNKIDQKTSKISFWQRIKNWFK